MRPPIARRPVTGACRILRRRRLRGARGPLRHPLSLLYRQSGQARTAAPAAVRAADGRAVTLAPRLQIALHLSLTLNEQHRTFQLFAAPEAAMPAMPAATATPTELRVSTSGRLGFPVHSTRLETAYRTLPGARGGSPLSFGHSGARGNAAHSGRQDRLVHAWPAPRQTAPSSGGAPGQGYDRGDGGRVSPAASRSRSPRLQDRFAAGPGGRVSPAASRSRSPRLQDRFAAGPGGVSPRARGGAAGRVTDLRSPVRPPRADRHPERPAAVGTAQPGGTNRTALRSRAAGPAADASHSRGQPFSRLTAHRLPSVTALAPLRQPGRAAPPRAADLFSTRGFGPSAAGTRAPLYLAERSGGRTAAPAAFGSPWTPPPLDYRSAAPPAPPPRAEAPPAAAAAPSRAAVDIEAVSRNVISRIEKRLRIERERRGRS